MFAKKPKFRSSKLQQKKKRILKIRITLGVILLIALIWGVGYWARQDFVKVDNVRVEGNYYSDTEEVKDIAFKNMEGNHLFLIPKSSAVGVPEGKIREELENTFHEIEKVEVDVKGFKEVRVDVVEYEPVAKWCTKEEISKCYFLNRKSKVFLEEPLLHDHELIIFKGIIADDPLGKFYTSEEKLNDYLELVKLFRRNEITITEIDTEDGETFIAIANKGAKILFDREDQVNEVYENLVTALERDAINKAQFENIDYIDLRFENRVFYKLK